MDPYKKRVKSKQWKYIFLKVMREKYEGMELGITLWRSWNSEFHRIRNNYAGLTA
jgi:hypothetical protein